MKKWFAMEQIVAELSLDKAMARPIWKPFLLGEFRNKDVLSTRNLSLTQRTLS